METAYIILNGNLSNIPKLKKIIRKQDILVCADGASDYAYKQGLIPDVIIGDLDSISKKVRQFYKGKNVIWKEFSTEKDFTDAELAITYTINEGYKSLVICGLLGDRLDHMISNIIYISELNKDIKCIILESNSEIFFTKSKIMIEGKKGDEISLIPVKQDCHDVTTNGLYYPLKKEMLAYGKTRGVSNIFIKNKISINLSSGILMVVHTFK